MEIRVKRRWFSLECTIGELYVDGVFECYTLEDVVRAPGVKVPGKTAIQANRYPLVLNWSQRFKRIMPEIVGVPMFTGVRVHWGNVAANTDGCVLVGKTRDGDFIGQSREAFDALFNKIEQHLRYHGNHVFITIENQQEAAAA